jgi:hypothetical protein
LRVCTLAELHAGGSPTRSAGCAGADETRIVAVDLYEDLPLGGGWKSDGDCPIELDWLLLRVDVEADPLDQQ